MVQEKLEKNDSIKKLRPYLLLSLNLLKRLQVWRKGMEHRA